MHLSNRWSEWVTVTKGKGRTFTFADVESSLSSNKGKAWGAKRSVDEMHSCKRFFKSCAVIPYGSFGGGLNVIGK